jgi:hypothetical protein
LDFADTLSSQEILTDKVYIFIYLLFQLIEIMQVEFVITILQPVQIGFAKLSILFFYRRIFCSAKRNFISYATMIMIVLVVCWMTAFFLVNVFGCGDHFSDNWGNDELVITQCFNVIAMNEGCAASDFGMDLIILLLPIRAVS